MPKLKPIGSQPPTEPGWYWLECEQSLAPSIHKVRVQSGRLYFTGGAFDGAWVGDAIEYGYRFQPVAKPEME